MKTVEQTVEKRLAGIVEGYLNEKSWATEKRLETEILTTNSPKTFENVLENSRFSYLHKIHPERLEHLKAKFLSC